MAHAPYPYPRPPRPAPTNVLGIAGFTLSLVSLATCGMLSPLALLVSLLGLWKQPRGLAWAGTAISGVCTVGIVALFSLVTLTSVREIDELQQQELTQVTRQAQMSAKQAIERYRVENDGRLPEGIEGNKRVLVYHDGWGTELRYDLDESNEKYLIRSAGKDRNFDTKDDILAR